MLSSMLATKEAIAMKENVWSKNSVKRWTKKRKKFRFLKIVKKSVITTETWGPRGREVTTGKEIRGKIKNSMFPLKNIKSQICLKISIWQPPGPMVI
jgi:hypothetical protein